MDLEMLAAEKLVKNKGISIIYLVKINRTHTCFLILITPVIMRFGLCMPAACNQAQLDSVFSQVSESLTVGLQNLLKVYNPGLYFLPDDVSIQVQIQKTEEYEQTWYSRIEVGTVIVSILIILLIITLLVFTLYNCVKMRIPQKVNKVQVQQSIAKFDSTMDQTYFTPRNNFNNINHTTLQMSQTSSSNQLIQTQNNEIVQQPPIIPISKLQMILQSFSLQKSFAQIHQYRQPIDGIKDMSDLNMFDGFRVLVLIWVLLLGTCQYTMSSAVYNPWRLQDYFQTIAYTAVYSANLGFDEFFMISAFFTTFKVLQVIQKSESKTLTFKQYLNLVLYRYLRLAPLYYLVFLFGWLIGPHMGSGPCWLTYEKGYSDCSHYWWSVFTMTLNFFPSYVIANEGCFFWGWYVASEFQLFIITPLIVLAIYKLQTFKKRAFALTLLLLLGIGIIFLVIWVNKMAAGLFAPQDKDIFRVFVNKPYTKIHSVAIGISLGFIFEELNRQKMEEGPQGFFKSLDRNKLLIVFSQLAAWGLIAFVSLYPLEANKEPIIQNIQGRPIFLICLCVIILNLFLNNGKILKRFLSAKTFLVFGRFSFAIYLIFPIIISVLVSSMTNSLYLNYNEMFWLLGYNIVASFLFGFFVHMIIERPIHQLFMVLLEKKQGQSLEIIEREKLEKLKLSL